jgi:hypothetical protein
MEEAKLIYQYKYDRRRGAPKGWKKLGSGAYRTAYLSPTGIVYKIAFDYYEEGSRYTNNNDEEFNNYLDIARKNLSFRGWRIPKLYAYTWIDDLSNLKITVNAMEYVEGEHEKKKGDEAYDEFEHVFGRFGLYDCQPANWVLSPSGHRYIVDLAC